MKENDILTFLMQGFIFDPTFCPKKDKLFCTEFIFRKGMPKTICDLVLYLQSEGLHFMNISWYDFIPVLKNAISNTVFYKAFWSLIFNFFFKRWNHEKDPYPKCGWISALHNRLLYDLGTCFADTGILVWHLFSLGLLKPSLLHLI